MTPTPTRARHIVTLFAVALAVITYVDRAAINVSAIYITKDLGLTTIQMGWAFAAFGWAYALFEIPGGWLGDKIGPRRVLHADRRLVVVVHRGDRLGVERHVADRDPGAVRRRRSRARFPNMTRMFTTWLPVKERERAQANLWLATRLTAAFTPVLVAPLIQRSGGGGPSRSSARSA